jgi:hypothetical protein
MRNALAALVFCFGLAVSASLHADVLQPNQWYEFSFIDAATPALGCYPADMSPAALNCLPSAGNDSVFAPTPPWNFNVNALGGVLEVTDAFLYGDAFYVFDNNNFIFATPVVLYTGAGCLSDPEVCILDPNSSHAAFGLGPGMHSITIMPYQVPYAAGSAYFELVETPTPEPNELLPSVVTVLALCTSLRKRVLCK